MPVAEPADVGDGEESLNGSDNDPDLIRRNDDEDEGEDEINENVSLIDMERDSGLLRSGSDDNCKNMNDTYDGYFDAWEEDNASMSTESNDDWCQSSARLKEDVDLDSLARHQWNLLKSILRRKRKSKRKKGKSNRGWTWSVDKVKKRRSFGFSKKKFLDGCKEG